jgi:hypothetical protein
LTYPKGQQKDKNDHKFFINKTKIPLKNSLTKMILFFTFPLF